MDPSLLCLDRVPLGVVGQRLRRHRPHRLQVQDGRAEVPRLQSGHGGFFHGALSRWVVIEIYVLVQKCSTVGSVLELRKLSK